MTYLIPLFVLNFILGAVEFFLPIRLSEAGVSITLIAVVFSVSSFCSVMLDIPAGKLSDRLGRERMIQASLVINCIAALILFFSSDAWVLAAAGVLFGIGYGLNWSPMLALVGDTSNESNRGAVFGRFFSISALGEALAPIALVFLALHFGAGSPFLVVGIIAFLCVFLFSRRRQVVPAPEHTTSVLNYASSVRLFASGLSTNVFLVATGFFVAFFWQSVWFSQPLIGFYESSILDTALIVAAFSLPTVLLSGVVGRLIDVVGERTVFLVGSVAAVFSFLGFYFAATLVLQIIFIFVAAVGVLGVWLVMDVLTTRLHAPEERGEFFGILETVRDISYMVTPLFIALLYPFIGLEGVFLANATLAGMLLIYGIVIFAGPLRPKQYGRR